METYTKHMHLATLSVVALTGFAVFSVGNARLRMGKPTLLACLDLAKLGVLTIFWFTFFHVLNS